MFSQKNVRYASDAMRRLTLVLLCVPLLLTSSQEVHGAQAVELRLPTQAEFAVLPEIKKREVLLQIGAGNLQTTDLPREIIVAALEDAAVQVRRDALSTISARASVLVGDQQPAADQRLAAFDRLRALRPLVVRALSDEDARARTLAVDAIGYLEFDPTDSLGTDLSPDTVRLLARTYRGEVDPKVRATVVRAFAVIGNTKGARAFTDGETDALIGAALADPEPAVRQWAVRAAFRSPATQVQALEALKGADPETKIAACTLLSMLRERALPFEPQVREAFGVERDARVKSALESVLKGFAQLKPK